MSQGYVVIAQNSGEVDYLEQAYALAMSIKISQSTVKDFALCVDPATREKIRGKHRRVFDHIVDIPWGDAAADSEWKIHNKWKYYHMTPFDHTVVLDTDMLMPSDVSHWWQHLMKYDFWATTHVRDFRGNIAVDDFYRKTFRVNDLPNVYTAFMYFRKSHLAAEIFCMTEIIMRDWQKFFWDYLGESKPDWLSGDVAFALAIKILGVEHLATQPGNRHMPTFVHMKSHIQDAGDQRLASEWCDSLPTYYGGLNNIKIGNYVQSYPLHYSHKAWLTPDIIHSLEIQYAAQ